MNETRISQSGDCVAKSKQVAQNVRKTKGVIISIRGKCDAFFSVSITESKLQKNFPAVCLGIKIIKRLGDPLYEVTKGKASEEKHCLEFWVV